MAAFHNIIMGGCYPLPKILNITKEPVWLVATAYTAKYFFTYGRFRQPIPNFLCVWLLQPMYN